jgi:membrane associated rhomboid family serine protease
LERTPGAVAAGQWWRLVTPWFVHAEDRRQMLFNFMAVVGTFVERILAAAIGFYCILSAECLASLRAAGTSVARCGLLGALAVRVLARKTGEDVLQAHSSSWGPPFWFSFPTFMVRPPSRAPYSLLCF